MNKKRKPKRYVVVLAYYRGQGDGRPTYFLEYVSAWPKNAHEWGARFEISPNRSDALYFGRDSALDVANTIRMRNAVPAIVMVEEA